MARVTKKNISEFQDILLGWFKENGRHFSWRKKGLSNYELVIAEVLLQRTKADTVEKFYVQFIKDFPHWKAIVNVDISVMENYLKPVGLYRQRAKRLQNLALEMVKRKGKLPRNREELESISFMGQYIANAVELVIFNEPSPLLDVNMARVLERFFGPRKMADIRYDPYLQSLSFMIVNHPNPKKINWAILDFAALICKAHNPIHEMCPMKEKCTYFKSIQ